MRTRKRKRRLKPAFLLVLIGAAILTAILLVRCATPETVNERQTLPTATLAPPVTPELMPTKQPTPAPAQYVPDETEVELLARMLWGEARGITSDMEKAACVWCVLNRVDDERGLWPDTVEGVLTQKNQFAGFSYDYPATDELKALASDVMTRWQQEKTVDGEVGRVLPKDYYFFTGDGKNNHFRAEFRSTELWDWTLPNPYEN